MRKIHYNRRCVGRISPCSPGSAGPCLLKNSAFAGLCGHASPRNNFTLVKFKQVLLVIRPIELGDGVCPLPPDSASPGLFKNSAFTGLCGHAPYRNNFTLVKFKGHVKFDHYTLTLSFFCQTVTIMVVFKRSD